MEEEQAINMAVTCVMTSMLDNDTKEKIIDILRKLERK